MELTFNVRRGGERTQDVFLTGGREFFTDALNLGHVGPPIQMHAENVHSGTGQF